VKFRISISVLFVAALVTCAPAMHAQTEGSPSSGGRSQWRAMGQEMMAACADKDCRNSLLILPRGPGGQRHLPPAAARANGLPHCNAAGDDGSVRG